MQRDYTITEAGGLIVALDDVVAWPLRGFSDEAQAELEIDVHVGLHEEVVVPDTNVLFGCDIGESERLAVYKADGGAVWAYPDGVRIFVDSTGANVRCEAPDHYEVADTLTYVLGPILGYALRLRGVPCLHAATVSINGRAVALCGAAGAGKSTTAAAAAIAGHELVAEDVCAVRRTADHFEISVGPAHFVKLWGDSASWQQKRKGLTRELPPLTRNWDKRMALTTLSAERRLALGAIVFLEPDRPPNYTRLSPRDAIVNCLDNVYVSYALSPAERAADVAFFADVVERVPAYRLGRPSDFDQLPTIVAALEEIAAT